MSTVLNTFKSITRFDIESYLNDFAIFASSNYQKIVDYYEKGSEVPSIVLDQVTDLYARMLQINNLFGIYKDRLSEGTVEMWALLDIFESTKVTLLTVKNSARWMRSTKNVFRSNAVNKDYILKQGQGFETLATEVGYSDSKNDWAQIALNNDVIEEDYSFEGGNKMKITFVNDLSFSIDTVIDSVNGEKIYGKDLDRILTFENNDFKCLGYKDTIIQQTQILVGLLKGSVPEFPLDGISKELTSGNINVIQYPSILRQQSAVFEKDARYKSIAVSEFKVTVDALVLDLIITTRLEEELNEQLVL